MVVMQLFSGNAGVLAKNKFTVYRERTCYLSPNELTSAALFYGFCCSFYFISTVII